MQKTCLRKLSVLLIASSHSFRQTVFGLFLIVLGMTSAHATQREEPRFEDYRSEYGYGLKYGTVYTVHPYDWMGTREATRAPQSFGQWSEHGPWGETVMSTDERNSSTEQRMALAKTFFEKNPQMVPQEHQDMILQQRVILGMTPYEAHLAAGGFSFRVIADQSKWPAGYNPYHVMWRQSTDPDNSEIWMTFQTDTQFSGLGSKTFRVHFQLGQAVDIQMLVDEQ